MKKEIEIALWRESDTTKSRFLPLLYQKCSLPWFLKDKVYADFSSPESYEDCVARVLQRLGLVSRPNFLVCDLGGGTIDCSVIKIKDEFRGKVDIEALARDVKDLGIKYETKIRDQQTDDKTQG